MQGVSMNDHSPVFDFGEAICDAIDRVRLLRSKYADGPAYAREYEQEVN